MEELFPQLLLGGEQKFLSTADLQRGQISQLREGTGPVHCRPEGGKRGWANTGDPRDAHSPDSPPLSRGCSTSTMQEAPTHM